MGEGGADERGRGREAETRKGRRRKERKREGDRAGREMGVLAVVEARRRARGATGKNTPAGAAVRR